MAAIAPAPLQVVDEATAAHHRAIYAATAPAKKTAYKQAWKVVNDAAEPFTKLMFQVHYTATDHENLKKLSDSFKEKIAKIKQADGHYSPLPRTVSAQISILLGMLDPVRTTEVTGSNSSEMQVTCKMREEFNPSDWPRAARRLQEVLLEVAPPTSCPCSIQ